MSFQERQAYRRSSDILSSTAIGSRKYRIPSDLRSQAGYRLVSTMVGDHMGILGVVVFWPSRLVSEQARKKEHGLLHKMHPLFSHFWMTLGMVMRV